MNKDMLKALEDAANEKYVEPTLKDVWPAFLDELKSTVSKEDWDGYGAYPVSDQVFNNANTFISLLEDLPLTDITPNAAGTLGFEFENNSYVEIGKIRYSGYISHDEHRVLLDGKIDTLNDIIHQLKETLL